MLTPTAAARPLVTISMAECSPRSAGSDGTKPANSARQSVCVWITTHNRHRTVAQISHLQNCSYRRTSRGDAP